MSAVNTIRELKLLRKDLKNQLHYHQNRIAFHTRDLITAGKLVIAGYLLQKSILYAIRRLIRKKKRNSD